MNIFQGDSLDFELNTLEILQITLSLRGRRSGMPASLEVFRHVFDNYDIVLTEIRRFPGTLPSDNRGTRLEINRQGEFDLHFGRFAIYNTLHKGSVHKFEIF